MITERSAPGQEGEVNLARALTQPEPKAPLLFDAVYEAHVDFVYRTVVRKVGPREAEDVTQEVFLTVHRRFQDFDPALPIRAWLYGITLRICGAHRRTFRRRLAAWLMGDSGERLVSNAICSLPSPSDEMERAQAVSVMNQMVSDLDADKREAFVLAYSEELPITEVAACLGLNLNTAYSRVRAARQHFDAACARHLAREANWVATKARQA